jgi:hypothetical protein
MVGLYFHETERDERHRWTLQRLLMALAWHRPRDQAAPDRTFVVGGKREYLAISTEGPDDFTGQHPLWGANGTFEGAMRFQGLTMDDVRQVLEKFYDGRRAEGCFAPYDGQFQFYVPPQRGARARPD